VPPLATDAGGPTAPAVIAPLATAGVIEPLLRISAADTAVFVSFQLLRVTSLTLALVEPLWLVAVMVALALLLIAPVATLKVAVVAAATTVTDAGMLTRELVFDREMLVPPLGAGCGRVTVQVVDEFGPMLVGLQAMAATPTEAARLTVVAAEMLL